VTICALTPCPLPLTQIASHAASLPSCLPVSAPRPNPRSDELAAKHCARRVLRIWRVASMHQARRSAQRAAADAMLRSHRMWRWLGVWRLSVALQRVSQRAKQQRAGMLVKDAFAAWRGECKERMVQRVFEAAAQLHRHVKLCRTAVAAFAAAAEEGRLVELPPTHPTMRAGEEVRRRGAMRRSFKVGGVRACGGSR
jgi:hypothetical protein